MAYVTPNSLPLSLHEVILHDGMTIVSTTDLRGVIQYANPYLIAITGYDEAELMGTPHKLLRHPDMPVAAFADLWATIERGQPWTGMLKNRCKNGDFFWVLANITPVLEQGRAIGYMAVQTKPSRDQVGQAEQAYQQIREGKAGRLRIDSGQIVTAAR